MDCLETAVCICDSLRDLGWVQAQNLECPCSLTPSWDFALTFQLLSFWSVWATITKYQILGSYKQQKFLAFPEKGTLRVIALADSVFREGSLQSVPSHCIFIWQKQLVRSVGSLLQNHYSHSWAFILMT